MKVAITKTRDGQLTKVIDQYETKKEAQNKLKNIWDSITEGWDIDKDSDDRLEKDLLVWDVYTYRIEKIEK